MLQINLISYCLLIFVCFTALDSPSIVELN